MKQGEIRARLDVGPPVTHEAQNLDRVTHELDETWLTDTCWFCRVRPSVARAARVVGLRRIRCRREEKAQFDVPRCARCRSLHRIDRFHVVPAGLAYVCVILLVINMATDVPAGGWSIMVLMAAVFLGGTVASAIIASKSTAHLTDQYPRVRKLRRSGWD